MRTASLQSNQIPWWRGEKEADFDGRPEATTPGRKAREISFSFKEWWMRTLDERVKLTLDYMNSPEGIHNWFENHRRGYDHRMNVLAAIQIATRLIVWERIDEVYKAVNAKLHNQGAAA
jgi:hypothetical protein